MESLTAPPRKFRALWPYLCWAILTLALLGWQYHRTRARQARVQFTVQLEGQSLASYQAILDDSAFEANGLSGVGWKTLKVVAPDAEPFETNLVVWYKGLSLGTINLQHSRGTLQLEIAPLPNRTTITGKGFQREIQDCSQQELQLPVGEYQIEAAFERFSVRKVISARRNETTTVPIRPSIGVLEINSDPSTSSFRLESTGTDRISIEQTTPATITALPTGPYKLTIWRDDYRKVVPVNVTPEPTNRLTITFDYATIVITSDPAEAMLREGENARGKTPTSLSLAPGRYSFRVEKEGYFPTNLNFAASGGESRQINITLANIAFTEALENARSAASGFLVDYTRALSEVERALKIKPNDETALKLRNAIEFNRHLSSARQFNLDGKHSNALTEVSLALKLNPNDNDALNLRAALERAKEDSEKKKLEADRADARAKAEERRNRPREVFRQVTNRMRFNELFEAQTMQFTGSLTNFEAALVRALGRNPKWGVVRNEKVDSDTLIMQCDLKAPLLKQYVVLVAGQSDTNEVVVYFKLFHFTLAVNLQPGQSGNFEDGYMPVHPQYISHASAQQVQARRSRNILEFKKRIEQALP